MKIRHANESDGDKIKSLYLAAFDSDEAELVSQLAMELLAENCTSKVLSFLAVNGESVFGHVAFSALSFNNLEDTTGYILAPLAVHPAFQKQRIGSQLVRYGLHILAIDEIDLVLVYGDPNYYNRFGFTSEIGCLYLPPYNLQYPFGWLGMELHPCNLNRRQTTFTCVDSLLKPELW